MAPPVRWPTWLLAVLVLLGAFVVLTYINTRDPAILFFGVFAGALLAAVVALLRMLPTLIHGGAHVHCPACGVSSPVEARHCAACGAPLGPQVPAA